jgi:hypothetical protein
MRVQVPPSAPKFSPAETNSTRNRLPLEQIRFLGVSAIFRDENRTPGSLMPPSYRHIPLLVAWCLSPIDCPAFDQPAWDHFTFQARHDTSRDISAIARYQERWSWYVALLIADC